VGVKSASVHYHFPTKGDLAESIVRAYTEDFSNKLNNILRQESDLLPRLDAFLDVFEDVTESGQLCLCGSIASDSESVNDATRRALGTFFNASEAWLAATLEEADQSLSLDLSPADVAKILMSGLEGAGLIDRLAGDTQHLDAFRRLTRQLVVEN
jgi:TetR/AcrR family transcriptional repressor of nem operon